MKIDFSGTNRIWMGVPGTDRGGGAHCQIRRVFEGTRPGRSSSIGSKFENFFPLFAALFGFLSRWWVGGFGGLKA